MTFGKPVAFMGGSQESRFQGPPSNSGTPKPEAGGWGVQELKFEGEEPQCKLQLTSGRTEVVQWVRCHQHPPEGPLKI